MIDVVWKCLEIFPVTSPLCLSSLQGSGSTLALGTQHIVALPAPSPPHQPRSCCSCGDPGPARALELESRSELPHCCRSCAAGAGDGGGAMEVSKQQWGVKRQGWGAGRRQRLWGTGGGGLGACYVSSSKARLEPFRAVAAACLSSLYSNPRWLSPTMLNQEKNLVFELSKYDVYCSYIPIRMYHLWNGKKKHFENYSTNISCLEM